MKTTRFMFILVCIQAFATLGFTLGFSLMPSKVERDRRYIRMTDSILDVQARMDKLEQENMTLFRMLRHDNDQRGVIPDRTINVSPVPLPTQPALRPAPSPGQIGDTGPGQILGDTLGFGETFGDTD